MKLKYTIPAGLKYSPYLLDLINNNHVLVAGTVGSGKSVLENSIIYAILCSHFPGKVESGAGCKMIFFDPKRVELDIYKNLPHCIQYADTLPEIENTLYNIRDLIDNRFLLMKKAGIRKSLEYPIYIFIDELVDLVTNKQHGKNIIRMLTDCASISRAANVFFICLTQSPSRLIIPAQFKLLFNCRIALKCNNEIESRQIIDDNSAVNLPRYGQAIVQNNTDRYYIKIPFYSDYEIENIVNIWNSQNKIKRMLFHL